MDQHKCYLLSVKDGTNAVGDDGAEHVTVDRCRELARRANYAADVRILLSPRHRFFLVVEAEVTNKESGPTTYQSANYVYHVHDAQTGRKLLTQRGSRWFSDGDPRSEGGVANWWLEDEPPALVLENYDGTRARHEFSKAGRSKA